MVCADNKKFGILGPPDLVIVVVVWWFVQPCNPKT